MSTTDSLCIATASLQLSSPFGRLPRELRDPIYHYLFQQTPYLIHRFSPYDADNDSASEDVMFVPYHPHSASNLLQLRYQHRQHSNQPSCDIYPEWLRACKMFMAEGTKVFTRNAEWYFRGYCLPAGQVNHWTNTSIPHLDTSNVTAIHFYVNNLANFEVPYRYEGTDCRAQLQYLAKLMRKTGMSWRRMRFVGHCYRLRIGNESCDGQAENMMRSLVEIFHSVSVAKWEFGIVEPHKAGLWVMYDWIVGTGSSDAEGCLNMVVRTMPKRHVHRVRPEDDLEKLLPRGWVMKRPECVCVDCTEEKETMGTGGWGPRPDQFGGRAKRPGERRYAGW